MKKLVAILIIATFVACGKTDESKDIKGKIAEYKEQISDLEDKIAKLEEQSVDTKGAIKLRVKTQTIAPVHFAHFVESSASLEAVNSAFISPEINGQVQTIHVQEGYFVQKGQLLISLNSDIIQSNIKELETSLELAKTVFAKQEELKKQKVSLDQKKYNELVIFLNNDIEKYQEKRVTYEKLVEKYNKQTNVTEKKE